jgi:hypothetical protein
VTVAIGVALSHLHAARSGKQLPPKDEMSIPSQSPSGNGRSAHPAVKPQAQEGDGLIAAFNKDKEALGEAAARVKWGLDDPAEEPRRPSKKAEAAPLKPSKNGKPKQAQGGAESFGFGSGPIGRNRNRNPEPGFPASIPCSRLQAGDANKAWLWRPYISPRDITLLSALMKGGKTTVLTHLLKAFESGDTFCGREVVPARVLYITEESESRWAARRDKLGLGDHVRFRVRPFLRKPLLKDWIAFLDDLAAELERDPADLVIWDTMSNLWPVVNENDAGEVSEALMPMRRIPAAQVLVHHLRKNADAKEATGSRGSGALTGFVDTILELKRFNPDDHGCRRRVLTSWGRDDESQAELVIELNADGTAYDAHGAREQVIAGDLRATVADLLPPEERDALTTEQIHAAWDGTPPSRKKLLDTLSAGAKAGRWSQSGAGKRGSPFRYWRNGNWPANVSVSVPHLRAGTETETLEAGPDDPFPPLPGERPFMKDPDPHAREPGDDEEEDE